MSEEETKEEEKKHEIVLMKGTALTHQQMLSVADVCVRSGLFPTLRDAAQGYVKIAAGQEIGIGPIEALTSIDVLDNGQIEYRAKLYAAQLRRSGTYDYRVLELTNKVCRIEFSRHGEPIGVYEYSWDDAIKAGAAKKATYQNHPRVMLFNRAISQGSRIYAPDAVHTYIEGEIFVSDEEFVIVDEGALENRIREMISANAFNMAAIREEYPLADLKDIVAIKKRVTVEVESQQVTEEPIDGEFEEVEEGENA
jgi:hypothetical protein